MNRKQRWAIVGGAGFIGSHLAYELVMQGQYVIIYDNFSSGSYKHLNMIEGNSNLEIVPGEANDIDSLTEVFSGCPNVVHLASNPDIAKAQVEPRVDFLQGTSLSEAVCEASRISKVKNILYASGSGVYREQPSVSLTEDSPIEPISTYGASKIAGEALLSAYSNMFGINVSVFRFANVVGPRQTHGVGFDFLKKLLLNPKVLRIYGNGNQTKSYIHVKDVVSGILLVNKVQQAKYDVYNLSNIDTISVLKIAEIVIQELDLKKSEVEILVEETERGWPGDVPHLIMNSSKIRDLGWCQTMDSANAVRQSVQSMLKELIRS